MKRKTTLVLALFLPLQIIIINILSNHPLLIETWYSNFLYPKISGVMRISLGILPFSFGDLLYAFLVILLIRWIIIRIKERFRNPKKWLIEAFASLSIIYLCFNLFWGYNYYRLPLHQSLEIDNEYTTEKLITLTKQLIDRSNQIHADLAENDSVKIDIPYNTSQLFKRTVEGYESVSEEFPELAYRGESLKSSLYSMPLSYMGFNGYLNPLTNEAQVNTLIVPYKIPTTASHELGHQLGFAKENEANFIACLVTMNHPDPYFRYSGFTFALRYCLNELYRRDKAISEELIATLNPGILANYREVEEFWMAHKNPFEPIFQIIYNRYLIANNQSEGLRSYSYVVALLVNYFEEEENGF
ncbi:DUF3810 domain-containing protein [Autumnicola psychrophila]|uniref:DUF3810 domain-containing protein n=1 Tax=Autumnicola psychrophila TaxID=3075592 RepID=A0ABU3DUU0_9FLAO|nr:DUF3810 domain-containing protein [Zunongwangia sp. F225]MDT0687474.1 DUF3810 domain-containing protein [Zunongwangia sp. F225]